MKATPLFSGPIGKIRGRFQRKEREFIFRKYSDTTRKCLDKDTEIMGFLFRDQCDFTNFQLSGYYD
jgi:hypothetical protein